MKIKKEETELLRFVRDRLFLSSFFPDYQIPMRPMRPMRVRKWLFVVEIQKKTRKILPAFC